MTAVLPQLRKFTSFKGFAVFTSGSWQSQGPLNEPFHGNVQNMNLTPLPSTPPQKHAQTRNVLAYLISEDIGYKFIYVQFLH